MERKIFLDLCEQISRKGHVKTQGEGGEESSPEPDHVGTMISDFQTPEVGENTFLFFNLLSLWHFVWQLELTNMYNT